MSFWIPVWNIQYLTNKTIEVRFIILASTTWYEPFQNKFNQFWHGDQATVVETSNRSFEERRYTLGRNSNFLPEMLTDEEIKLRILDETFQGKKKEIIKQIQDLKSHYMHLKEVYHYERKQLVTSPNNSIGIPPVKTGTFLLPAPVRNSGRFNRKQPSVKAHTGTMK